MQMYDEYQDQQSYASHQSRRNEDYDKAKEFFLEAIGVEATSDLDLVYNRLCYYNESLQAV